MDKYLYFSATGTTKRVMEALGADAGSSLDITLRKPSGKELSLDGEDMLYIGFPVFGGRVPATVLERLDSLQGNGAKAVVVAVYGNRHYDDALKEMQSFLEHRGFRVVVEIAAVAQHSMVPAVAAGRPDCHDIKRLKEIKEEIARLSASGGLKAMTPRPEETYKAYQPMPVAPLSTADCTLCGLCARECPVSAIRVDDACASDASRCILCMRCVALCPSHARKLPDAVQQAVASRLTALCAVNKEIEVFYAAGNVTL